MGSKPLACDGMVVEGDDGICEDLVGVAPLAGNQHDITGTGVGERGLDGDPSVGLDTNLAGAPKAGQQVVENLVGVLGSGIAQCQDHAIGAVLGDLGEPAAVDPVAASLGAQDEVDATRGDGPKRGQGLGGVFGCLSGVDSNVEILALANRLKVSGDGLDRLQAGDDVGPVDLHRPCQGRRGQCTGRHPRTDQGQVQGQLAVETVEQHARARAIDSLEPRSNVNGSSRHGRWLKSEGDPACIEVDSAQDLGIGIVGIDHRHAARHDLAKELGLGPALLQKHFGRKPERRSDIGHDRRMKGDSFKAMVREGLAGDLEDAPLAAALDHLGQQAPPVRPRLARKSRAHDRVACEP